MTSTTSDPMTTPMICSICPRACRALREAESGRGFCRMGTLPRIARAAPHYGEEPCISGTKGSGTIFFSGCTLGCVFCQNENISHGGYGQTVSPERLRAIMEDLACRCHNVSLVSASHYTHVLREVLNKPLGVPVVYNTGGYDSVDALRSLEGKVQVWLPDLKYRSSLLSARCSQANDYFEVATQAILEMVRQAGPCEFDRNGILQRGVIVRHLVLPGYAADSLAVLRWCRDNLPKGVWYSVMAQYTPYGKAASMPPLDRRLTPREYNRVTAFLTDNDMLDGYIQELSASGTEEIPDFDSLTGVSES